MIEVKTRLRRWGNSFGIVVPGRDVERESLKEGDEVKVLMKKNRKANVLRETFGTLKFKKSVEQIMRETDKELYNE